MKPLSGSFAALYLTVVGCGGTVQTLDANDDGDSRGSQGPDDANSPDDVGPAPGDTGTGLPDGDLPATPMCGKGVPSEFVTRCSSCHSAQGEQNPRYPDLFAFGGSSDEFVKQVRTGGKGMPAFSEDAISDGVLAEALAYFKGSRKSAESPSLGDVKPLFAGTAAVIPITFMRDDGVLITRGAGRVRQRHELEETYGPFGSHYFEHRSYGFIVEDFTARGESKVRVTYLPVALPQDSTNFRAWKDYSNGNVFDANMGMLSDVALPGLAASGRDLARTYASSVAPYARVQQQEVTFNQREGRDIQAGDTLEFEFGVFIDRGAVRPDSRTNYYTDTFRYQIGAGGLTPENLDSSGLLGPTLTAQQGGSTSGPWQYAEPDTAYEQMALNMQHEHVQSFLEGRRLFHTDFANGAHSEPGNPTFDEQKGKAGPLFTTTSCTSCHVRNGGGTALTGTLDEKSSMVFKLYDAGPLGNQLQLQEGSARLLGTQSEDVTLADGSVVKLSRPMLEVSVKAGQVPHHSARVARRLSGMGLLEAIDETTLLSRTDPNDCDGDGISGRASYVTDPSDGAARMGRLGWKAEKVSVTHQVVDALDADLGVSTRLVPGAQGQPELNDEDVARLTAYMRLLGVPSQRAAEDPAVQKGEALFKTIGCASCHASDALTGITHPMVELRAQAIKPYTDLLLHDLGEKLADASGDAGDGADGARASASEWRTPPLWGVGMSNQVQGYTALLHDGRAKSVLEAVLWHGGEAQAVRDRVLNLQKADREALIRFVESL